MIDYDLVTTELRERQARAQRDAEASRLAAALRTAGAGTWTAAVRSAIGIRVARFGLRLAGARVVRAI
jgi:hypothetical protein